MTARLKGICLLATVAGIALVTAACAQLLPRLAMPGVDGDTAAEQLVPTDAPLAVSIGNPETDARDAPTTGSARPSAVVRRGSIAHRLPLIGRVVGSAEVEFALPTAGRIDSVLAKPGDVVNQGDVLLRIASQEIERELDIARANLDTSRLRLQQGKEQAEAQALARQRANARRAEEEASRRQAAVAEGEAALRRAQAELQRVQAGPSASEKRSAEIALTTARVNTQRAEADLARLGRGPEPGELRVAEAALGTAQTSLERAEAEFARLTGGPDPERVRVAERDIERARAALSAAESARVDSTNREAREAAIIAARYALQDAQERLTRAREAPPATDVAAARREVQLAQATLEAARERLDTVRRGPDRAAIEQASAAVQVALSTQENAEVLLASLNSRPTPAELRGAEEQVARAQAGLDRARTEPGTPPTDGADSGPRSDVVLLERAVDQNEARVQKLEASFEATRVRAPFTGTVASVQIRGGDTVEVGQTVMVLVKPGRPLIRVNVTERDALALAVGQQAIVRVDGADNVPINATLTSISEPGPGSGTGRIADFTVDWTSNPPPYGKTGQLQVTDQQRDNVLLVPRRAVRVAGVRRYVQYQEGLSRRTTNVEVGLISGEDAEIVSGLVEGQLVLLGP